MDPSSTERPLAGRRVVVANWRDLGHHLAGGAEVYAWHAARALRDAGAQVTFVTSRDGGQDRREHLEGIEIVRGGGALGYYLHAAWQLWRRRRRLDLVVDPECGVPSFSPLWVRRATAVVLVVHHVHLDQFDTYFPAPVARVGQLVERRVMPRLYRRARTVAVSASTVEDMRARLGWQGPVDIVANGTLLPEALAPASAPGSQDDGKALGPLGAGMDRSASQEQGPRLLVLGRLVPHKRVDLVLRAVAALLPQRPGLRLDVAGKGPDRARLESFAQELGLGDAVTFHGYVSPEHKADLLRAADLHICSSDVEGWGQVVVEAAGHGVPTLARDVPGLRESIRDGLTGWLVDPAPDLSAGLQLALDDLDKVGRREALARACRAWAAGFSWDVMHRQVVSLALEELGAPAAGPRSFPGAPGASTTPDGTRRHDLVGPHVPGRTER